MGIFFVRESILWCCLFPVPLQAQPPALPLFVSHALAVRSPLPAPRSPLPAPAAHCTLISTSPFTNLSQLSVCLPLDPRHRRLLARYTLAPPARPASSIPARYWVRGRTYNSMYPWCHRPPARPLRRTAHPRCPLFIHHSLPLYSWHFLKPFAKFFNTSELCRSAKSHFFILHYNTLFRASIISPTYGGTK
jgi:hypothetical protein